MLTKRVEWNLSILTSRISATTIDEGGAVRAYVASVAVLDEVESAPED